MKKTAVIYRSRYGYTRQYAQWLAEELACELYEGKQVTPAILESYETVIYGGGLYAGGVNGLEAFVRAFGKPCGRQLVIFSCGLADPQDETNIANIRRDMDKVLSPQLKETVKIYHLRGGIDYSRLNMLHKIMMSMMYRKISGKEENQLNQEERQFLETYGKVVAFTDRNTLAPIVSYVRGL